MNIIEATRKALKHHKRIYQSDYPEAKMQPYLSIPFDIMLADNSRKTPNWNPTGTDILSDKWEICD